MLLFTHAHNGTQMRVGEHEARLFGGRPGYRQSQVFRQETVRDPSAGLGPRRTQALRRDVDVPGNKLHVHERYTALSAILKFLN